MWANLGYRHCMQHYLELSCRNFNAEKQHSNKVLAFGVSGAANYAQPCILPLFLCVSVCVLYVRVICCLVGVINDDDMRTPKPSTVHQGHLSLSSLRVNRVPTRFAELRRRAFTCVGWQVTLCDLIWQVTLHSSEIG